MTELHRLADGELLQRTEALVQQERELLTKVLHLLREVDRRKLFSSLGYRSLFEFSVKKLGYSEAQACRRIDAMRLLRELPELEHKISEGTLNLTHLGMAQNLFRQEKKLDRALQKEHKLEILEKIASKPVRETERLLFSYSSKPDTLTPDRVRTISEDRVELKFTASKELLNKIETLKGYLAHSDPNISLGELVEKLCDLGIESFAPSQRGLKNKKRAVIRTNSPSAPKKSRVNPIEPVEDYFRENSSLYCQKIPREVRSKVFTLSKNTCSICRSNFALEIDHIRPRVCGGTNAPENLRVLCRSCNHREGVRHLGINRMSRLRGKTSRNQLDESVEAGGTEVVTHAPSTSQTQDARQSPPHLRSSPATPVLEAVRNCPKLKEGKWGRK